jgi:uncharacterized protein YjiS (DUF1127 family)
MSLCHEYPDKGSFVTFRRTAHLARDANRLLGGIMNIIAPDVVAFYRIYPRLSSYRPIGLTSWLGRLIGTWRRRIRERQAFAKLDCRELRDIGLSRWDVERELAKPFWRG